MDEIERTVGRARWRMNVALFLKLLSGSLTLGLALVALAWAAPKIWALESWGPRLDTLAWYRGWLAFGLATAVMLTAWRLWRSRLSRLDAAVEVDARFGLRERLSSAVALDADAAQSPVGQALLADAAERAERIDIRDQFPIRLETRALWLLVPVAAIVGLSLIPDAQTPQAAPLTPVVNDRKPIEVAVELAQKKLQEEARKLDERGLKEAAFDLKTLAKKLDSLPAGDSDLKKEALVKLNDVRDELDRKRSELGDAAAMRENLAKLKQPGEGTVQKLAQALAETDFEQAKELVQELARKLKAGELSEQERKRLGADLNQLAKAAEKLVQEHEQAKREIEDRIRQAQMAGDQEKVAELQQKLEQREAMDRQIEQVRKAAENLKQAGKSLQPQAKPNPNQPGQTGSGKSDKPAGEPNSDQKQPSSKQPSEQNPSGQQPSDGQAKPGESGENQTPSDEQQSVEQAQQALEDLAEQMEQMELDRDMLEQLQDLEQNLQECKNDINGCPNPGEQPGAGDSAKRGQQQMARGNGQGHGERELAEDQTGEYQSKVKGRLQRGETVKTGDADGPNLPGSSAAEARELIKSEMSRQTDPLEDQQLPRSQREQAKEYFEKLRGGR